MLRNAARLFVTNQHRTLTTKTPHKNSSYTLQHLDADLHDAREALKQVNEFLNSTKVSLPKYLSDKIETQLKDHESNKLHAHQAKLNFLKLRRDELLEHHRIGLEQLQSAEAVAKAEKSALKEIEHEVNKIEDEINAFHALDENDIDINSPAARGFARRRDL